MNFVTINNLNYYLNLFYSYNKYTVFHDGEDVFNYLVDLQTESTELDFWLLTRNMSVVTVSPTEQSTFESRLNELNAQFVAKPLMEEM